MMDKASAKSELLTLIAIANSRGEHQQLVDALRPTVIRGALASLVKDAQAEVTRSAAALVAVKRGLDQVLRDYARERLPAAVEVDTVTLTAEALLVKGYVIMDAGEAPCTVTLEVPDWCASREDYVNVTKRAAAVAVAELERLQRAQAALEEGTDSGIIILTAEERATLDRVQALLDSIDVRVSGA